MDNKELIEHWKVIIRCVFQAEQDINNEKNWQQILRETKDKDNETRNKIADQYVGEIAERIIEQGYMKFEGDGE